LKPCARCEEELPLNQFDSSNALFCRRCTQEMMEIVRRKYGILAAALFRAQLRQQTKQLHAKYLKHA
jgi:hypothetical protein